MRLPPEVVEEAKEMVKKVNGDYPELEDDVEAALRSGYVENITLMDASILLKYQDSLCLKCGECCRRNTPIRVTLRELRAIARYMNTSLEKLLAGFRLKARRDGLFDMEGKPCPFLRGNICMIYPVRPDVCREFPAGFILYQIKTCIAAGRKEEIKLPAYCGVVKEIVAQKLAAAILMTRLKRENPEAYKLIAEQIRKLIPKDLDKLSFEEHFKQVMMIIEKINRQNDRIGVQHEAST